MPGPRISARVAVGGAAGSVHLPQAVLRGDVALRNEQVGFCGGIDMRHAMRVAADDNRRGKSGQLHIAIELRQSGFGRGTQPQNTSPGSDDGKQKKTAGDEQQNARPSGQARTLPRGARRTICG